MNDDELKKLWQEQPLREPELSPAQVLAAAQSKMGHYRGVLDARDLREFFACAVVIVIFGIYAIRERTPVVRIGWLMVIAGAIFVAARLMYVRRTTRPAPPGTTVIESLRAELNSVRTQSRLLETVVWWYLLPIGIGLLVATWGMPVSVWMRGAGTLFYVAVFAFVYWLNLRARSQHILPMQAQLESLLRSAETGESIEATHVANLRPVAYSIAAGASAKPVEFGVAYWQIALYAEIGFVGIWFFGMLDKTQFHVGQMLLPRNLIWIVPAFLGGLLLSWLLKKGTERALGVSALGLHLSRGFVFLPWDEITDVRTFRFFNVRSLWLIRASGPKMITPWTSLERHTELRAAVEKHAPANHPIREYLHLLKRR